MSHLSCPDVEALAAELALGIAAGDDRAHALAHLARCPECRALVDEMSRAADSLLLVAPQAEPPIGFEARVLERARPARKRITRSALAAVAAAALLSSAVTAAAVHAASAPDRRLASQYERLVKALGGKTLRAAELRALDGTVVGKVYAYDGKPSWLFLVLQDREGSGQYEVEIEPVAGDAIRLAGLTIQAGRASWSTTASVQIDNIQSVNILDATGTPLYGAEFQGSK